MAQLILSNRAGATDEVVSVLADGAHPGKKVVAGPWNGAPFPKFRIIHLPGQPVSAFAHMMERDPDETVQTRRRNVLDLPPAVRSTLQLFRQITLDPGQSIPVKRNPRGSGR